jgi:hypothetical protein
VVAIKKINLNLVEENMEDVVLFSSKIKNLQEELKYLDSRTEINKKKFSSGKISKSLYNNKNRDLEKEKKKINKNIISNIKKTIAELEKTRKSLNSIEI